MHNDNYTSSSRIRSKAHICLTHSGIVGAMRGFSVGRKIVVETENSHCIYHQMLARNTQKPHNAMRKWICLSLTTNSQERPRLDKRIKLAKYPFLRAVSTKARQPTLQSLYIQFKGICANLVRSLKKIESRTICKRLSNTFKKCADTTHSMEKQSLSPCSNVVIVPNGKLSRKHMLNRTAKTKKQQRKKQSSRSKKCIIQMSANAVHAFIISNTMHTATLQDIMSGKTRNT